MARIRGGTATYHMLVEALRPYHILQAPGLTQRTFRWVSSIHWERGIVPEKDMVIVCREKVAHQAKESFPEAFLIILTKDDCLPPPTELDKEALYVQASTEDNILQKLQNFFLELQLWHNELANIAPSEQAPEEVLRLSGRFMDTPLLLCGMDGHIISTSLIPTDSSLYKAFEQRKTQIIDSVSLFRRSPIKSYGTTGVLYVENRLIRTENENLFYLLALYDHEPSAGTCDLLDHVAYFVLEKSGKVAVLSNLSRHSIYALFDDLINRRYIGQSYLDDYAIRYGFSLDAEFRLLCFKQSEETLDADPYNLMDFARKLNGGKCLAAVYNGDLCALLHSKELDNSLSTQLLEEEFADLLEVFDGHIAVSQVFNGLDNLAFAYQQTELVSNYRPHVDFSRTFAAAENQASKLCYTFEEALVFALVDSDAMTQEMKDFAFSHTILEKIIAEDATNGGEDARILSSYLHYERKATLVAEKLHMHRNTVLYRIGKIEKRFGLDFDQEWSRYRVTLDFSILYCKLLRDDELRNKLTGKL